MPLTSKTWCARLAKVFPASDENLSTQLVRVSVLYEDLKIEFEGASAKGLQPLDGTGVDYRRFYFLRRTVATLLEMRGAFAALQKNQDFKGLKSSFPKAHASRWKEAIEFLEKNHETLKALRNAVGGHFHDSAAQYGVSHVSSEAVGLIEVQLTETKTGAGVRFKFAGEFVALALMKDKPQEIASDQYVEQTFTMLRRSVALCSDAAQILADQCLVDRFR